MGETYTNFTNVPATMSRWHPSRVSTGPRRNHKRQTQPHDHACPLHGGIPILECACACGTGCRPRRGCDRGCAKTRLKIGCFFPIKNHGESLFFSSMGAFVPFLSLSASPSSSIIFFAHFLFFSRQRGKRKGEEETKRKGEIHSLGGQSGVYTSEGYIVSVIRRAIIVVVQCLVFIIRMTQLAFLPSHSADIALTGKVRTHLPTLPAKDMQAGRHTGRHTLHGCMVLLPMAPHFCAARPHETATAHCSVPMLTKR